MGLLLAAAAILCAFHCHMSWQRMHMVAAAAWNAAVHMQGIIIALHHPISLSAYQPEIPPVRAGIIEHVG